MLTPDASKKEYVRALMDRGDQRFYRHLTAEDAVEVGLVTNIITEKLDIFPA
jgi:ATP-dependent protease ClpP protease subunit